MSKRGALPPEKNVIVLTLGKNWAMAASFGVGGAIGAAVAGSAYKSYEAVLLGKLREAGVDPARTIGESIESRIRTSGVFGVVPTGGDAAFSCEIKMVGLAIRGGFTSDMSPMLRATAKLTRGRDGKVIWEATQVITNQHDGTHENKMDVYMSNPEILRAAFQQAAELLAARFVKDMLGERD